MTTTTHDFSSLPSFGSPCFDSELTVYDRGPLNADGSYAVRAKITDPRIDGSINAYVVLYLTPENWLAVRSPRR